MKKGTRIEFTATPFKGRQGTVISYISPAAGCGGWVKVRMDDGTIASGAESYIRSL